jgi:hypothetical protein
MAAVLGGPSVDPTPHYMQKKKGGIGTIICMTNIKLETSNEEDEAEQKEDGGGREGKKSNNNRMLSVYRTCSVFHSITFS